MVGSINSIYETNIHLDESMLDSEDAKIVSDIKQITDGWDYDLDRWDHNLKTNNQRIKAFLNSKTLPDDFNVDKYINTKTNLEKHYVNLIILNLNNISSITFRDPNMVLYTHSRINAYYFELMNETNLYIIPSVLNNVFILNIEYRKAIQMTYNYVISIYKIGTNIIKLIYISLGINNDILVK